MECVVLYQSNADFCVQKISLLQNKFDSNRFLNFQLPEVNRFFFRRGVFFFTPHHKGSANEKSCYRGRPCTSNGRLMKIVSRWLKFLITAFFLFLLTACAKEYSCENCGVDPPIQPPTPEPGDAADT